MLDAAGVALRTLRHVGPRLRALAARLREAEAGLDAEAAQLDAEGVRVALAVKTSTEALALLLEDTAPIDVEDTR